MRALLGWGLAGVDYRRFSVRINAHVHHDLHAWLEYAAEGDWAGWNSASVGFDVGWSPPMSHAPVGSDARGGHFFRVKVSDPGVHL